jgi:hypothetical protein
MDAPSDPAALRGVVSWRLLHMVFGCWLAWMILGPLLAGFLTLVFVIVRSSLSKTLRARLGGVAVLSILLGLMTLPPWWLQWPSSGAFSSTTHG